MTYAGRAFPTANCHLDLPSRSSAKPGVSVTLMYSMTSDLVKARHARELASEAEKSGETGDLD